MGSLILEKVREYHIYPGRFHPDSYSIGLKGKLSENLDMFRDFPIDKGSSEEIKSFSKLLTFHHEIIHLYQFVSTSFGLRTLRLTNGCAGYLEQIQDRTFPIIEHILKKKQEKSISEIEEKAFEAFGMFLENSMQLRLEGHNYFSLNYETISKSGMDWIDFNPIYVYYNSLVSTRMQREDYAKHAHASGFVVKKMPIINFGNSKVILNTAALMEAQAILAEINLIILGFEEPINPIELLSLLPKAQGYFEVILYALENHRITPFNFIPTLTACIDIALMYDPFILFGSSIVVKSDINDRYPGQTFVDALKALEYVKPIRTKEDFPGFYKELCNYLDIPDPTWMAERTFQVANDYYDKINKVNGVLKNAFSIHKEALEIRRENPLDFPFQFMTLPCIKRFLEVTQDKISFYDLETKLPEEFKPELMDQLMMCNLVFQAIMKNRIECPLKKGEPFYCRSHYGKADDYCLVTVNNDIIGVCFHRAMQAFWEEKK